MLTPSSFFSRAAGLAALAVLGFGRPRAALADPFPALHDPASTSAHPGKFIWVELFTTDAASATRFYTGVFGWSAMPATEHGVTYTIFQNGSQPVAGLRLRSPSAAKHASRWIPYLAVPDLGDALAAVTRAGGEIKAPARSFPRLGELAIVTDPEGEPVGLIHSSTGDGTDAEAAPGEWNWFHLLAQHPAAAADFYHQVVKDAVVADDRPGKSGDLLLTSEGFNRGGLSALPVSPDAKGGWLGVIRVEHIEQTLTRVLALGGEVMVAPREATLASRFAVIADPTGGTVGLVEYANQANPVNQP